MNVLDPIALILSTVDCEYPNNIHPKEIVQNREVFLEDVKFAEKNGLYYYFIHRLNELNVDLPFLDQKHWDEEQKKLLGFKETITLLNSMPESCKDHWAVIKACTTLPHIPRDVDVFVPREKKKEIIKALENKGMECVHSDDIETTLAKGEYTNLDLYTRICYFGVECMDDGFLLSSFAKDEIFGMEYTALNEKADFLLTILHNLFGHGSMTLLDFLHIKSLRETVADLNFCRNYAYEHRWGQVFDLTVQKIDTLYGKIYKKKEMVSFPYLFSRSFILKCVSVMEELNMTKLNKSFLYSSLIWDKIVFQTKGSLIYNTLRSIEPLRKSINSLGYLIRHMRGDKYN